MWRCVSRAVREALQRAPPAAPPPSSGAVGGAAPSSVKSLSPITGDGSGSHQNEDSKGTTYHTNLCEAWINAFSWSGAIVLGWYASQVSYIRQKRYTWDNPFERRSYCFDFYNKIPTSTKKICDVLPCNDKNAKQTFSTGINFDYYPISPFNISNDILPNGGEVVDKADSEFKNVLRSIENKLGIIAIDSGKLQEGLAMLQSSAQRNYAPALFNLAVCYEKGLAVKKDEIMAMEFYRAAAVKNHPEAMYNLAVFYGQGRGGLPRDMITAKELMHVAAAQGSEEAVLALKLIEKQKRNCSVNVDIMKSKLSPTETFLSMLGCDDKVKPNDCVLLY